MKVFLAYEGNYDDRGVVGVYSSHERAIGALVQREAQLRRHLYQKDPSSRGTDPETIDPRQFEPDVSELELDFVPGWEP